MLASSQIVYHKVFQVVFDCIKYTFNSFDTTFHMNPWKTIDLCFFSNVYSGMEELITTLLFYIKNTCGGVYLNSQHPQIIEKFSVWFCTILQHQKIWNKLRQFYCNLAHQVQNWWRLPSEYHKTWIWSSLDKILCMSCIDKHTQSHGSLPYLRGIGVYFINCIMVDLLPILFKNQFRWNNYLSDHITIIDACRNMSGHALMVCPAARLETMGFVDNLVCCSRCFI